MPLPTREWITRAEAAEYLTVSVETIDRRCLAGVLRFKRVQGVRRIAILREDVLRLLPLPETEQSESNIIKIA